MNKPKSTNPLNYNPEQPDDFIGAARGVARMLDRILADSQADAQSPIKLLLNGPPGTGKSALIGYLQRTAGCHPTWSTTKYNGTQVRIETVEDIARSLHFRDLYSKYRLIWIDEADKIPSVAQVRFLTLMDDLPSGVILACTSNCKVSDFEPRFQSRFQVFEVGAVPDTEIEALLGRWCADAQIVRQIATFACGNVRQALLDLKGALLAASA